MANNRRIYRDIQKGLKQLYPAQRLNGHQLKHLTTLTAMVSGIVQGKSCRLEKIAREIPNSTQVESRVKRYSRLLQHEVATLDRYYLPFVSPLIDRLSQSGSITLVIDGSEVGRQCMTLMISAVYHGRAIPLTWLVVQVQVVRVACRCARTGTASTHTSVTSVGSAVANVATGVGGLVVLVASLAVRVEVFADGECAVRPGSSGTD